MAVYYLDGTTLSDSTSVYTDAQMTTCAPDGFYSNGVIVRELSNCVLLPEQSCPDCTEKIYLSSVESLCSDFCDGLTNYPITTEASTTNNHSYDDVVGGDTISGSIIPDGYYAYAATVTDTNTGTYRVMLLNNNFIEQIFICSGGVCSPI